MKNRTLLYSLIGIFLIIFGLNWLLRPAKGPGTTNTFNATVNRDCAPWDGGAFTISIPYDHGSAIEISVWRSPDFKYPVTFSYPDPKGNVGSAFYKPLSGATRELIGSVFFQYVEEGKPITGDFDLRSGKGDSYEGSFIAIWGNIIVMCG